MTPGSTFDLYRLAADDACSILEFTHTASCAPCFVPIPVEPVPDERPDRDPADLERFLLKLHLDRLVLRVRALRSQLDPALVLPEDASEMYFRKMSPRTTCLYSAASIELRSASAIPHSSAS